MATQTITAQNFEATIQSGTVILDFWASWCGPCRAFAPVFEAASAKHQDIVFGKIDTEAEPALAQAFQIRSIPTLMIFRDGIMIYSRPGALPPPALAELIQKAQALDMDEVRKEIEKEMAKQESNPAGGA